MSARRHQRIVCVGRVGGGSPLKEASDQNSNIKALFNGKGVGGVSEDSQVPSAPRLPSPRNQASVPPQGFLPALSPRNTRSGANPIYPISVTRHMVQGDVGGAGYISPRDQFGSTGYTEQQKVDKAAKQALEEYRGQRRFEAEARILSGRARAEGIAAANEARRIEVKRQQREVYEQLVAENADREQRRARNWM